MSSSANARTPMRTLVLLVAVIMSCTTLAQDAQFEGIILSHRATQSGSNIFAYELSTGEEMSLTSFHSGFAAISPGGRFLTCAGGGSLYIVDLDKDPADPDHVQVLVPRFGTNNNIHWSDWSLDGKWIYFCTLAEYSTNPPYAVGIWRVRPDGSELLPVSETREYVNSLRVRPVFGDKLIYSERVSGAFRVCVKDLGDGSKEFVTPFTMSARGSCWSPDGAQFAYIAGAGELCVADYPAPHNATVVRSLGSASVRNAMIAWLDCHTLVYVDETQNLLMVAVDIQTGRERQLGARGAMPYVVPAFVPPTPKGLLEQLLSFIASSVEAGTLVGRGPGGSAPKRLNAFVNKVESACDSIEEEPGLAYLQLLDAYAHADGNAKPPDFVTGEATAELAERLLEVIAALDLGLTYEFHSETGNALVFSAPFSVTDDPRIGEALLREVESPLAAEVLVLMIARGSYRPNPISWILHFFSAVADQYDPVRVVPVAHGVSLSGSGYRALLPAGEDRYSAIVFLDFLGAGWDDGNHPTQKFRTDLVLTGGPAIGQGSAVTLLTTRELRGLAPSLSYVIMPTTFFHASDLEAWPETHLVHLIAGAWYGPVDRQTDHQQLLLTMAENDGTRRGRSGARRK